jgi:WD40 repeat protein/energy-coupling factor transporter ATP-binding protein EcfA2
LQLAIFNSCDGLGLALELEQLHIGQMIVMREPVPDQVAQSFLTYFLAEFAGGKSFYLAERKARLKLHGLEDNFPCASWLPAIFQNPAAVPPMWQDLGRRPTDVCPYRGLFAFREEDAPFFYGRDAFTQMLVEAVQKQSLVAVIGPSGSGKSSVVFAGLIPQLRSSRTWLIEAFRPGDRPFRNLAAKLVPLLETHRSETDQLLEINKLAKALRQGNLTSRDVVTRILEKNSGDRFLLVVDQFEELYTLCRDARERLLFLDSLLEAVESTPNFTLVLTLRADFLGQALSYRPFGDALQYADLKLSPMNREELQAAVEQPATMLGVTIESGLTERIIDAVSAEPGDLPLLEFALTTLWAKQRDAQLTHAAYEEIGGVEAALSRYAEEAYGRLNEEEKERARRIFIQLVRPGEGTEDTRRLATRTEVGEENWDLVTRLADERLVVSSRDEALGEETVEIVHEALIGGWFRLRLWIELDRAFRTWQERLRASLRQWEASGKDEGALLRGVPLAEAEGWLQSRAVELSPAERSFIEQSGKARTRQRQRFVFGLSIGLVGALTLAGIAGLQWQRAEKQRQVALARQLAVQAQWIINNPGATNEYSELPRSVLLAVEAIQRFPSLEAQQVLHQGLALLPRPVVRLKTEEVVQAIAFSPDGKYLAVNGGGDTARLWEVASRREVTRLKHAGKVRTLAFSRNGKYLATVSVQREKMAEGWNNIIHVWVWEGSRHREVARLSQQPGRAGKSPQHFNITFSPDGKYLAAAVDESTAWVWEVASRREVMQLKHDSAEVVEVAFSSDSKYVATAGRDKTARVWEVATRREVTRLKHELPVIAVAFSPDGKYLVTGSEDRKAWMWEIASGREVARLENGGRPEKEFGLAFSLNGKYLATATGSITEREIHPGIARVWDATSRREIKRLIGASSHIALSPDGKYLATAAIHDIFGNSKSIQVWEVARGREVPQIMKHEDFVVNVAFSPNGKYLATASLGKTARLWDATNGHEVARLKHEGSVNQVAFSPDGKYLATAGLDNTARVWDGISGREVARMTIIEEATALKPEERGLRFPNLIWNSIVAFSPDSKYLATASWDKVKVWEATSGREVMRLRHEKVKLANSSVPVNQPDGLIAVTFSSDGRYLAAAGQNIVRVWESQGGREVVRLSHPKVDGVTFSRDGKYLATTASSLSGGNANALVWDTTHGRQIVNLRPKDFGITGGMAGQSAISFSPDGRYLAVANWGQIARVWEATTGREVMRVLHDNPVHSIAFSPDGKYLVTSSGDRTARVWQIASSREVARVTHKHDVTAVAFSPDGKYLATASWDKTARVQLWRSEDLIEEACTRLTGNLTPEEWNQYLPGEPDRDTCPNLRLYGSVSSPRENLWWLR